MKFAAVLLSVATLASAVSAYTTCQVDCMTQAAASSGCSTDYTSAACLCDSDAFATATKQCLYQGGCTTDVADFYTDRTSTCGASVSTFSYASAHATAAAAAAAATSSATTSADVSTLTTCQVDCLTAAASTANCSSSDYTASSCMCDDAFATASKACLYSSGCGTDVPTFYSFRSGICGSSVSTFSYAAAHSSTAAYGAQATSVSMASSSSSDGGLSNAASGGIGAAATVAVFAALVAALYAAGMVRFGKKRNEVSLDTASVTSSEYPIKPSHGQIQHA